MCNSQCQPNEECGCEIVALRQLLDVMRKEATECIAELRILHDTVDKLPKWAVEVRDICTSIDSPGNSINIMQLHRLEREITEAAAWAAGGE